LQKELEHQLFSSASHDREKAALVMSASLYRSRFVLFFGLISRNDLHRILCQESEVQMLRGVTENLERANKNLNDALNQKTQEIAKHYDSYESAFEEKLLRRHVVPGAVVVSADLKSNCTSDTATAISPQGTYRLKSSLMFEDPAALQQKEIDCSCGQLSQDLLRRMAAKVQQLEVAVFDMDLLLTASGGRQTSLPSRPGACAVKTDGHAQPDHSDLLWQSAVENGGHSNGKWLGGRDEVTEEMHLSAIGQSAPTFVLSSPNIDRFEAVSISQEKGENGTSGQVYRRSDFTPISVAFDTCDGPASTHIASPRTPSMMVERDQNLEDGSGSQWKACSDDRGAIKGLSSLECGEQQGDADLFSARQRQARIERHFEREALLQLLDM
jgi:hypothetical protein